MEVDIRDYLYKEKQQKIKEFRKNSLIDMHTHTIYSDGELTPNELISYAVKNNVGTLSITDHDTITGIKNISYGYGYGVTDDTEYVRIIPGVELTAKVDKGLMHILGYGIDINNKELNNKLSQIKDSNINYIILLLAQINKDYGIKFSDDDIKKLFKKPGNLGRPDIARLCIEYSYSNSVQDAFNKYLVSSYDKLRNYKEILTYNECIKVIVNSGGIPVLAHPKSLKLSDEELKKLIENMIKIGLKGIEVYHSSHNEIEQKKYLNIAKEYNLLISGGSDYHGKNTKPDVEIGTGVNNNLYIKRLSLLKQLKKDY